MARASNLVREKAPGLRPVDTSIIDEATVNNPGKIKILNKTGAYMGELSLGGRSGDALVVVESRGISRGSGCEVYKLESVHTDKADHYLIEDLLPVEEFVILEPIDNRGNL